MEKSGRRPLLFNLDLITYILHNITLICLFLSYFVLFSLQVPLMEKSGRRPLLLGGMALMWICAAIITVALNIQGTVKWMSYVNIVCIIGFVIGFAIGLGKILLVTLGSQYDKKFYLIFNSD